jgi:uncharacterized iron-regulated membrane protein
MMSGVGAQLKKTVILIHRWMGVAFCLLFLFWFSSGIVMMYWDYPSVSAADRLSRAPALDPFKIRLSLEQAYSQLRTSQPAAQVLLETFDGRPVYRFRFAHAERIVYADDGQEPSGFPSEMTLRIASAWTRETPGTAKVDENTEEDQWTVPGEFRALRPMRKYMWPDGEQVYVSTVTGNVEQYTTRASRVGAYCGAVPHWLYFTTLRKHAQQWSRFVIWASGLGTIVTMLGIVVGIWIYSPSKRYRYEGAPSSIPYVGQKRWHSILGLIFGLFACTWAFSGMLSMDPFPQLQQGSSDETDSRLVAALRGTSPRLDAFASKSPREALLQVGSLFQTKELEFTSFAGKPFYLATGVLNQTRIVPVRGEPSAEFSKDQITEVLRRAAQPATLTQVRLVTEYEAYYLDRHNRLPLPVIFVQMNDKESSSYYVDPKTARIVQSYNSYSRRNRWLYHGLHSIDLPWLYKHRPAWDIVVLALMLGGTSLCITSLILAWRVLRRKMAPWVEDDDSPLPRTQTDK